MSPSPDDAQGLTIGALASAAGVNVETIRFYQRKGLLPEPGRTDRRIRRYADDARRRVLFIKAAQRLGFSLDEVAELLQLDDGAHCEQAQALAERKLVDVRDRLADLRQMAAALDSLVASCASAQGAVRCPLIEALQRA